MTFCTFGSRSRPSLSAAWYSSFSSTRRLSTSCFSLSLSALPSAGTFRAAAALKSFSPTLRPLTSAKTSPMSSAASVTISPLFPAAVVPSAPQPAIRALPMSSAAIDLCSIVRLLQEFGPIRSMQKTRQPSPMRMRRAFNQQNPPIHPPSWRQHRSHGGGQRPAGRPQRPVGRTPQP